MLNIEITYTPIQSNIYKVLVDNNFDDNITVSANLKYLIDREIRQNKYDINQKGYKAPNAIEKSK